ncbi:hypothetical protein SAMD00019534_024220 [Acytostelium subglobosum LB1]|uniref:hypothetical protein n=1 Tax=Acytostelium subglobosum LB1 TaxID=1410327 RepID=UPI000644B26F|nr:hypothetical protein SAMD00019534_024220 [Acytostelium subglobosum LB1]GAM19247.1 hypothetical protein SAMD00019534_024220 [Acytostelium subglobosum LB1]|eukprot:XP_012757174.1 hypothetical protein SAMD00019534_024220 [Acytostelium subglobosum LB1]
MFFFYGFFMVNNFATTISFVVTLYNYPHIDDLDDEGKKNLKICQIISTVGLGLDVLTQVWNTVRKEFWVCSIVIVPPVSLMPGDKWVELNQQKGTWPVFKLKCWTMCTHNFLLLASTSFYIHVLAQHAPVGQRISVYFKIISLLISMGIFFFIELPIKCCMHKTGKEIDKKKEKIKQKFSKKDPETAGGDAVEMTTEA